MAQKAISFVIKDPSSQLEPSSCNCKAFNHDTIQKVVQHFTERSGSSMEHLRVHFNGSPVLFLKADGTPTNVGDLNMKDGDVLEISHRHGKPCRFCKRTINIKLRAENGYACSYKIDKRNPLKNIITGFANFSLTSVENLRLSYLGKRFKLEKPDGKLITPADLKMGDWDQVDILHQR